MPPPVPRPPGRSWIALVYYYIAALIGLVIVITGAIIAVNSAVDALFFDPPPEQQEFVYYDEDDRGDHLESALKGLLTAAVGAPIFWWHVRQARRTDQLC